MTCTRCIAAALATLLLVLTGCSSGGGQNPAEPPQGWETTEARWWKQGVDTSKVFRNLESLNTMGIVSGNLSFTQSGLSQEQFNNGIKRSLLKLYRNDPATIDSLFEQYAVPRLDSVDLGADNIVEEGGRLNSEIRGEYRVKAYKAINNHYREPRAKDSPSFPIPDSLLQKDIDGTVSLEMHLDASALNDSLAQPDAIKLLEGVHPTIDAIVMRTAYERAWQPAYLKQDGQWVPKDAWVRFEAPVRTPGGM